jgi:IS5 family transposase
MQFFKAQQVFDFEQPDWSKDPELLIVDQILNQFPAIFQLAAPCFSNLDQHNHIGRTGMTLEQTVRCTIYMRRKSLTYRELAVHTADSKMGMVFMKMGYGQSFSHQTLQQNISKITADVLYDINVAICQLAMELEVDDGKKMRSDSTAIMTDIHYPTNCSLLWDCIRVCSRILKKATKFFVAVKVTHYQRSAKKLNYRIVNTQGQDKRIPLFKKMLKIQHKYINYAKDAIDYLSQLQVNDFMVDLARQDFLVQLQDLLPKMEQVYNVAYRHEILKEPVAIEEKLFSIFETHTDYIKKGRRTHVFGHKINLTSGKSNLIFDVIMERGNPSDKGYFPKTLDNIAKNYQLVPRDFATDGGYASFNNLIDAQNKGVKNIVFTKSKGKLKNIVSSKRMETMLKKWRSGIEAIISNFKRGLDARRCNWKGYEKFQSYILWSVITFNLIVIATNILKKL